MTIRIITTDFRSHEPDIRHIRESVFVGEQHVPQALEWDGEDDSTLHLLAIKKHRAIGTARAQKIKRVFLSAQVAAIPFYKKHEFVITSDVYLDAGIPRKDMELKLA